MTVRKTQSLAIHPHGQHLESLKAALNLSSFPSLQMAFCTYKKKNANMAIYMDNTTVHVSADSIESVNNSLQQELMLESHWIVNNKFKFNK